MPSDIQVLTENETRIIEQIRNLRPYETLSIMADKQGRPDSFLLQRSSRVMLVVKENPVHVRSPIASQMD